MSKWILRELLSVLLAWTEGDGSLATAIWSWFQVITGQVRPSDKSTKTPVAEPEMADTWEATPALSELMKY